MATATPQGPGKGAKPPPAPKKVLPRPAPIVVGDGNTAVPERDGRVEVEFTDRDLREWGNDFPECDVTFEVSAKDRVGNAMPAETWTIRVAPEKAPP